MTTPTIVSTHFIEQPSFQVRKHCSTAPYTRSDVLEAEATLLSLLEVMPEGGLLPVDFDGVRISSEAARQLLKRALLRIRSGELPNRYLVLGDLGDSQYNVDVMLQGESLTMVERVEGSGPELRGVIEPVIADTWRYVVSRLEVTASEVVNHFKLTNISTATNRLSTLSKLALARRIGQRSIVGGGREFLFSAVQ